MPGHTASKLPAVRHGLRRERQAPGRPETSKRQQAAEAPPKKHRDKPSSHTNVAGSGGETE